MTRLVVAPGGTITSAWGNQAMDQGTIIFTGTAQRDADWPAPPAGANCYVTGVGWQRRVGGAWVTTADATSTGTFVINGAGSRIIRGGQVVVSTSASGVFTVAHGLGAVPTWAAMLCADRASAGVPWVAAAHQANWDATNLEAAAYGMGSATGLASKSIRVAWVAGLL